MCPRAPCQEDARLVRTSGLKGHAEGGAAHCSMIVLARVAVLEISAANMRQFVLQRHAVAAAQSLKRPAHNQDEQVYRLGELVLL